MRGSFQGVINIIRFNWHFYALSAGGIFLLLMLTQHFTVFLQFPLYIIYFLVASSTVTSLMVSWYVYDLSGLYTLHWLTGKVVEGNGKTVNMHAGFDETSDLLQNKFRQEDFIVLDFYDPLNHTEVSIKRARKIYSPYPGTKRVSTRQLPLADRSVENVFVIFSAHEIRNDAERVLFFKELHRALKPTVQIVVVEHLRDMANFLAYNIGFFHFYTRLSWSRTFQSAGLKIQHEIKFTPFISIFILNNNGDSF
jgi:hypothetical protein